MKDKQCPCKQCLILPVCRNKPFGLMVHQCKNMTDYIDQMESRKDCISIYANIRKVMKLQMKTRNTVLADGYVAATTITLKDRVLRVAYDDHDETKVSIHHIIHRKKAKKR